MKRATGKREVSSSKLFPARYQCRPCQTTLSTLLQSPKGVFRSACWVGGNSLPWTATEIATRGSRGPCARLSLESLDHIVAESSVVLPASRKSTARTDSSKCLKSPFGTTKSTHKFSANDSLTELAWSVRRIIGTAGIIFFSSRAASSPFILGMDRSRIIKSGLHCLASEIAS